MSGLSNSAAAHGVGAADLDRALDDIVDIALAAGRAIMTIYEAGPTAAEDKADGSPVTAADRAADAVIRDRLIAAWPDVALITEESVDEAGPALAAMARGEDFWLVDPLDGTKEYIARNGEFTVNIALVQAGTPKLGVVHAPALKRTYAGIVGVGAWTVAADGTRRPIAARTPPDDGLVVVGSRRHGDPALMDAALAGRKVAEQRSIGSSLKFTLLAEGTADVYPRFGPTMEWDTAAGHAVLLAAGGRVLNNDGTPLAYAKPDLRNPHFIAWGE